MTVVDETIIVDETIVPERAPCTEKTTGIHGTAGPAGPAVAVAERVTEPVAKVVEGVVPERTPGSK
jgi:hypothetical protein